MRVGRLLVPLLAIQLAAANDLYAALGVSRNADSRAIKKAYRKMALQNHPDKQASLSDEQKKAATADFVAASNAYEVLSDPEKRRLYDRHGEAGLEAGERPAHRSGAAGFGAGDPRSEVFEAMFGTRRGSGGAFGGSGRGGTAFMDSRANTYRQAGGAAAAHEEERAQTSLLAYLRAQQRRQEQLQEQQRQRRRQQQARQYQQQKQQQQQARQYQQQAAQADAERQARQAVFDAEARAHAEAQAARRASKPKGGTGRRRAKLPRSQVLDL